MVGHEPVDESRLHTQTVNNKVAEDELVELDIANETCRGSRGCVRVSLQTSGRR